MESLHPSKAVDIEKFLGKFLRDDAVVLARPIYQLCNVSNNFNYFPRSCQIGKVKLIFKNRFKTAPQNDHPISLAPLLSKITEMTFHDQTHELLSKNNIFYRLQSGFRKSYSTNNCLGHLTDKITTGFEKGFLTRMILIDFQEPFVTIDHQILIKK